MKKAIVFVTAFCLAMVGFSGKVMAGPVPLSAHESAELKALASNDSLLTLKAGGAFPNAPVALAATEKTALSSLSAGSPNLENLKGGDAVVEVSLGTAILILILVILIAR